MCALPARSMPGSEMLFVEKTRIRGSNGVGGAVGSVATGAVMGHVLRVLAARRGAVAGLRRAGQRRTTVARLGYLPRRTKTRS